MNKLDETRREAEVREQAQIAAGEKRYATEVLGDDAGCAVCGRHAHASTACPYRFGGTNYNHISNPDGV